MRRRALRARACQQPLAGVPARREAAPPQGVGAAVMLVVLHALARGRSSAPCSLAPPRPPTG